MSGFGQTFTLQPAECSNSSIGYSITGTIGFNSNVMIHYCTAAAGFLAVVITVNLISLDYYACNILLAQYTKTSLTQNILIYKFDTKT